MGVKPIATLFRLNRLSKPSYYLFFIAMGFTPIAMKYAHFLKRKTKLSHQNRRVIADRYRFAG